MTDEFRSAVGESPAGEVMDVEAVPVEDGDEAAMTLPEDVGWPGRGEPCA